MTTKIKTKRETPEVKEPEAEVEKKKLGRPFGAKTEKVIVNAILTACPKCNSTLRTAYSGTTTMMHNGEHDGHTYTKIVRRYCKCQICGQTRIDRYYE